MVEEGSSKSKKRRVKQPFTTLDSTSPPSSSATSFRRPLRFPKTSTIWSKAEPMERNSDSEIEILPPHEQGAAFAEAYPAVAERLSLVPPSVTSPVLGDSAPRYTLWARSPGHAEAEDSLRCQEAVQPHW